jgi:RyR domain
VTLEPDVLELVARAVHADYVRREAHRSESGEQSPSLASWEGLPETLRRSNRHQAEDIAKKMRAISCEIVTKADPRPPVRDFLPEEVEMMAKLEHNRWEAERRSDGWIYGDTKDVAKKESPYLVPWEELTEEVREADRDTVRAIPRFLDQAGLIVVRTSNATT